MFDFAANIELSEFPLILVVSQRTAVYANRAAADRIGIPGGWSAAPFSADQDSGPAGDAMTALAAWTRRMGNRIDKPGTWPRQIAVKSGLCKGTWLVSKLTNGDRGSLGTLITGI